jgi:hypothetical protein
MSVCLVCLRPLDGEGESYPPCARRLFGSRRPPLAIGIDLAKMHSVGLAMVGRTSLSGVQRKISVSLSSDKQTLQVAGGKRPPGSTQILSRRSHDRWDVTRK